MRSFGEVMTALIPDHEANARQVSFVISGHGELPLPLKRALGRGGVSLNTQRDALLRRRPERPLLLPHP